MADVAQRFFCHECSIEIPRIAADFTCPTCNSGFIEELGQGENTQGAAGHARDPFHDDDSDHEDHMDLGQVLGPLESILPGLLGGGGLGPRSTFQGGSTGFRNMGPGHIRISTRGPSGPSRPLPGGPQNLGMDQAALENALQDFIFNMVGMQFGGQGGGGGGGGGARFHFISQGGGPPNFQLHGNPGDYAWGRGGLDAIITQLLNQMDGAGPPPMAAENIQSIPTVKINKDQMEKSSSCSVCWEDFTEGEEVRLLECGHCFHSGCIVPWLELHGTCPVCRKQLNPGHVPPDPDTTETLFTDATAQSSETSTDAGQPEDAGAASGGGLSGMIQSAMNQLLRTSNWSSQPETSSSSVSNEGAPTTSHTNQSTESNSSRPSNNTTGESGRSTSDDDTPASRRQRLDSDLIDFDFD